MFSSADDINSAVNHRMLIFTDLQHPARAQSDIGNKYLASEELTMNPRVSRCVISGGLPSLRCPSKPLTKLGSLFGTTGCIAPQSSWFS